ncbi:MAG: tail fiber domain-containing protein [Bacteroidia bacterium]
MKKIILVTAICGICTQVHSQWKLTGNAGTNPGTNFIGTTDYVNFKIRTNNKMRMTVTAGGNVGIGTAAPASKLDVTGTITALDSYFGKNYPVSAGTSGASYSSVGYGLTFTDTTAKYRYRINGDYSSMLSFRAGGFDFNTAPVGTAGTVIFYTTAMAILQNGNVGIGTLTPANKLSVAGTGDFSHLKASGTSDLERVNMSDLFVTSSGSVAAHIENTGNTNSSHGLQITAGSNTNTTFQGAYFIIFYRPGATFCGGIFQSVGNSVNYGSASDKRLKNIIGTSQKGLSDLMKINIYDYTFKSDPNKNVQTGFMAQELYEIFPQAVGKPIDNNEPAEKNPWMVDYGKVTPLIIKSVQEQQQMIDELKKQNEKLTNENIELKNDIAEIKVAIGLQAKTSSINSSETEFTFRILPNPANETVTISFENKTEKTLQLKFFDASAKEVKSISVKGNETTISISELINGNYLVKLLDGNTLLGTQKITVNK